MLDRICDKQPALLEAAAAGHETDSAVADHLAACPTCREAVEAVCWMRRMSETIAEPHALPNPDLIWWKAQLLRRWEADRRASAPIERMHKAELFAGLASLVGFVVWQWSGLTRTLSSLSLAGLATSSPQTTAGGASGDASSLVFLFGSLFLGAMILAAVHRMLTDR
jgi:predicted anti-sigma-YlaC factor YlaD